jgi:DNA-binding transcriptional regulator PaaX
MMNQTIIDIHNELLEVLERKLYVLAAHWRSTKSVDAVRDYQAVLRCMLEMGYRDALNAEGELPDEFLPEEYLALHA